MKLQDKENLDIASAVSDVLEGKKEVKEISYPHKMYSKDDGKSQRERTSGSSKGCLPTVYTIFNRSGYLEAKASSSSRSNISSSILFP